MKNYLIKFGGLIAFICLITACYKPEPKYSCNPKTDMWVKKNVSNIQSMSRTQIIAYSLDTQVAIFRALTNENKVRVFNEKLDLLLQSPTITSAETTFLQKARTDLKTDLYDDTTGITQLELGYRLKAQNDLGWTVLKYYFTFGSLETQEEFNMRNPNNGNQSGGIRDNSNDDCWCKWQATCWTQNMECFSGCMITAHGCGWFLVQTCGGTCEYRGINNPTPVELNWTNAF